MCVRGSWNSFRPAPLLSVNGATFPGEHSSSLLERSQVAHSLTTAGRDWGGRTAICDLAPWGLFLGYLTTGAEESGSVLWRLKLAEAVHPDGAEEARLRKGQEHAEGREAALASLKAQKQLSRGSAALLSFMTIPRTFLFGLTSCV